MDRDRDAIERALGYPYVPPPRSFVQCGERTFDLGTVDVDLADRAPLLCYGSNAAPGVLALKLGPSREPVPVVHAELEGFDVVYSAHVSRYGSVPAALQRSPGTRATVFVAYLTAQQLRLVSQTEPNYELEQLHGVSCRLEIGTALSEVPTYRSRHGCLVIDGSEIALAARPAEGRRFPEMTQAEVLDRVRAAVRPEQSLREFIASTAGDPALPARWTAQLRASARPQEWGAAARPNGA